MATLVSAEESFRLDAVPVVSNAEDWVVLRRTAEGLSLHAHLRNLQGTLVERGTRNRRGQEHGCGDDGEVLDHDKYFLVRYGVFSVGRLAGNLVIR